MAPSTRTSCICLRINTGHPAFPLWMTSLTRRRCTLQRAAPSTHRSGMTAEAMEIALVLWAEEQPDAQPEQLKGFGLRACQVGVPPTVNCAASADTWKRAMENEGIIASSAVCSFEGEDYANLAQVHKTVGFTAPGYSAERIARTKEVSAFAAELGLSALSCHIGFIPDDTQSPVYKDLIGIAREL